MILWPALFEFDQEKARENVDRKLIGREKFRLERVSLVCSEVDTMGRWEPIQLNCEILRRGTRPRGAARILRVWPRFIRLKDR